MTRLQLPSDLDNERLQQVIMAKQQQEMMVQNLALQITSEIYVHYVKEAISKGMELRFEDYREFASKSKDAAPFVLEAFGMVKIDIKEKDNEA